MYIADAQASERYALRLLLIDQNMQVVGESGDWYSMSSRLPTSRAEMLLVDWELFPSMAEPALKELRKTCPAALVVVIIGYLNARQQTALPSGADVFIHKAEAPDRIAQRLGQAAALNNPLGHVSD